MFSTIRALRKEVVVMFVGSFVLLFAAQMVYFWSNVKGDEARQTSKRASKIDVNLELFMSSMKDIETGLRGYVLTNDAKFLTPYQLGVPKSKETLAILTREIRDGQQKEYLVNLKHLGQERVTIAQHILALQQSKKDRFAKQVITEGKGKVIMDKLREQIDKMTHRESEILAKSQAEADKALYLSRSVNIVTFFIALMMQVAAFFMIVREMLQRKEAEEHIHKLNTVLEGQVNLLNESNTALNAVNKELETFAYSVSHDLRSPLRGIDGFSLALLEDYGDKIDDTGKVYLGRVRSESQRMGMLIDGILSLSRLTRGEVNKSTVDLSDIATKLLDGLKQQQPDRRVKTHITPHLKAEADPRLIEPVLENLLNNAWKFTSKKYEANIEFGSIQKEDKTTYFVKDNGAGFDMAYVSKLFGPFQRLHGMNEFEGTGIGLATVQRIVNRHGGHIWVEAEPDKGATFFFTLT